MAEIVKRNKALSVSPLKSSQTVGAALAFLGFEDSIPMLHGSQGCTAFGKVFFVRHFREPIPLQTTAMDQVSSVMGADDNVIQGLKTICEKSKPALIGLPTTGLSDTQGSDVKRLVGDFRKEYPEFNDIAIIPVETPDFTGCLETGFAKAVHAMIDILVPEGFKPEAVTGDEHPSLIVLPGAHLTTGDLEEIKDMVELFGLDPVLLPDVGDSLDGHLTDKDFSPLTVGGTPLSAFKDLHRAKGIVTIGASMTAAGDLLAARTGMEVTHLDHVTGLDATDAFVQVLHSVSGQPVPTKIMRWRSQLQDAMLDTHFMTGVTRVAIANDPDHLKALADLVTSVGAEVVAAISPVNGPVLARVPTAEVKIGDLEELEIRAKENGAHLLLCNSHGVESAARLGIPLVRAGFPQYDTVGGYSEIWAGYRGGRRALFALANTILAEGHGEVHPYKSIYAQKPEYRASESKEVVGDASATQVPGAGWRH